MAENKLRIVFYGTPHFAVAALDALVQQSFNVVGVVTAPDRPAGRGKKLRQSAVKEYAVANNLPLLQPTNLKHPDFLAELTSLQPDLQVVVAFRMMPEAVWGLPPKGTFNLHGSLLPRYRGAAPINWAIINGETSTGVTTFFLDHKIDTGRIIFSETLPIGANETAGELHDRLMAAGAQLVVKTAAAITSSNVSAVPQSEAMAADEVLPEAPKLNPTNCRINWNQPAPQVFNHIRGLSPYPAAFSSFDVGKAEPVGLKVYRAALMDGTHSLEPGTLVLEAQTLKVACAEGFLELLEVQQAGKKRMPAADFARGFQQLPQKLLSTD